MKAGRNEPCPCGSGRKFKQCHGRSQRQESPPEEVAWRRLRAALEGHPSNMLRFIDGLYGRGAIDEAWEEFTLWDDEEPSFHFDTPHVEVFMPWFFHHWEPDARETSVEDASLHDRSPTSVLLEQRQARLDPRLRGYLEACLWAPFSFHEVLGTDPGRALRTRDLFMGTEHEVMERSASGSLRAGDILFGQLITSDGITLIEALARHAVPARRKLDLIDFRERISGGGTLSLEQVREWDQEIREMYLELMDEVLHPPAPQLQNTDGDDIVFHRMTFAIDSPRRAFDALRDLAPDEPEDELLADAEFGPDGALRKVEFPWTVSGNQVHKGWDNTIAGPDRRAER